MYTKWNPPKSEEDCMLCMEHKDKIIADMYAALKGIVRTGILNELPTYLKGVKNILLKAEGGTK